MVIQNHAASGHADSPTIRPMLLAERQAPAPHAAYPDTVAGTTPFDTARIRQLGAAFFAEQKPSPLPAPHWIAHDRQTADALNMPTGWEQDDAWLHTLSGNPGLPVQPLATVYSGHQFGVWAGQLGDGRALLLGERQGLEVQLKVRGLRRFHAVPMAGPSCAARCANFWPARPCAAWAFPAHRPCA